MRAHGRGQHHHAGGHVGSGWGLEAGCSGLLGLAPGPESTKESVWILGRDFPAILDRLLAPRPSVPGLKRMLTLSSSLGGEGLPSLGV